jgi:hypothetical protein
MHIDSFLATFLETPLNGKKKCGAYRGTFLVRVFPVFPLQFAYLLRSGARAAEQKLARHLSSVETRNRMSTRFLCIPADVFKSSKGAFRETISLSL